MKYGPFPELVDTWFFWHRISFFAEIFPDVSKSQDTQMVESFKQQTHRDHFQHLRRAIMHLLVANLKVISAEA